MDVSAAFKKFMGPVKSVKDYPPIDSVEGLMRSVYLDHVCRVFVPVVFKDWENFVIHPPTVPKRMPSVGYKKRTPMLV